MIKNNLGKLAISILCTLAVLGMVTLTPFITKVTATTEDYAQQNLGEAGGFTVFVFGNVTQSGEQVHGRMFVGGNAVFSNYGFGVDPEFSSSTVANLIVDGTYSITGGDNNGLELFRQALGGGNTIVSHSSKGQLFEDPATLPGTNHVDLDADRQYLADASAQWGSLAATSGVSVTQQYGQLFLHGTGGGLTVFNITADQLSGSSSGVHINLDTFDANTTVLINVSGSSVTFPGAGYSLNGSQMGISTTPQAKILWNMPDASAVHFVGSMEAGSMLAPKATYYFSGNGGQSSGTIIGAAIDGSGRMQPHPQAFTGNLPKVTYTTSSSSGSGSSSSESSSSSGSGSSNGTDSSSGSGSSGSGISSSSSGTVVIPPTSIPTGAGPTDPGSGTTTPSSSSSGAATITIGDLAIPTGAFPLTGDAGGLAVGAIAALGAGALIFLILLRHRKKDTDSPKNKA